MSSAIERLAVYIANLFFLTSDTNAPILKDKDLTEEVAGWWSFVCVIRKIKMGVLDMVFLLLCRIPVILFALMYMLHLIMPLHFDVFMHLYFIHVMNFTITRKPAVDAHCPLHPAACRAEPATPTSHRSVSCHAQPTAAAKAPI